jgi:hypothetical protein
VSGIDRQTIMTTNTNGTTNASSDTDGNNTGTIGPARVITIGIAGGTGAGKVCEKLIFLFFGSERTIVHFTGEGIKQVRNDRITLKLNVLFRFSVCNKCLFNCNACIVHGIYATTTNYVVDANEKQKKQNVSAFAYK